MPSRIRGLEPRVPDWWNERGSNPQGAREHISAVLAYAAEREKAARVAMNDR